MSPPKPGRTREFIGLSATGTKHGLLVQTFAATGIKFTITNPDTGKKHGSVMLPPSVLLDLAEFFGGE